jgi:hypothetical protein
MLYNRHPLYNKSTGFKVRKIIVLIFMCFIYSTTQAQIVRGYGLKIGGTIANQNWEYVPSIGVSLDPENRVGFNFGIFTELLDNPFFSLVTEVNYLQKGMKQEVEQTTVANPDGIGEFITWDTRVDYLNLSALGKLRLNVGIISPYIIAGPKIDFEINKSLSLIEANIVEQNFKKNIFGFKVGIGGEVNLVVVNLLVEFLYDSDLNDLYKNENLKVNSNSFDLRVGIIF